jgi:hypothetical protein
MTPDEQVILRILKIMETAINELQKIAQELNVGNKTSVPSAYKVNISKKAKQ